jgi:hypothetical protein
MRGLAARPFGKGGVTPRLTRTSYIGSRIEHSRVLSTCWTTNASLTTQPRARTLACPPEFVRCPTSNLFCTVILRRGTLSRCGEVLHAKLDAPVL